MLFPGEGEIPPQGWAALARLEKACSDTALTLIEGEKDENN